MQIIEAELQQRNIPENQLSQELQEDIAELRTMVKTYNEACDEFEQLEEPDEETEKELDDMEHSIVSYQEAIVEKIRNDYPKQGQPKPVSTTKKAEGGEVKKSSSLGWLIFGGAALALTFGVVNVWKKSQ
jgi:hypothetical protein